MKTIKQHLEELPEPYNWVALEEAKKQNSRWLHWKAHKQSEALWNAFDWYNSELGYNFWDGILENLILLGK